MVARLGFWTDDESTKINVNTAAEGILWDKPKANTDLGKQWSQFQPVINEVQRYPGHPATTSLSSVFFPGKYVDGKGDEQLTVNELKALLTRWDAAKSGQARALLNGESGNGFPAQQAQFPPSFDPAAPGPVFQDPREQFPR